MKFVLFFIAFLVGADELMLGPILAPIGNDLGVPPERITLFITAYSVALAVIAPLLGAYSDRRGRLAVMIPASVLFGLASVATGLVETFEAGVVTRVVTGLASAGMLPIAFALAADSGGEDAMKKIAWVQSGLTLGMIASPALGAVLAETLTWRAAFVVLGVCAWLVAVSLAFVSVRQPHRAEQPATGNEDVSVNVWSIPGAAGALLAMCFGLGGGIGLFNLVGQHLRDTQGLSMWSVGIVYAVLGVISVIGNVLMPHVTGRLESGRQTMRIALGVCVVVSVWFYLSPTENLIALIPLLLLWALAGGVGSPALQSYISELSVVHRGVLMSLAMTMMHLGVAIWSGIAGAAYSTGQYSMALLAIALFGIAIIVLQPVKIRHSE
ncbi:MFS transporter [Photobacterium sp. WH24]|uniref:MFS transporter n=1 Tax=Photobacterium sp. WH24 TaxID=2827237 RepID=UPI001C49708E|nr:MFS transporter [Photobacterium sp. WH24]MBV7263450.1 MFS transporter [Photobacterium sp. WH24]